MIPRKAGSFVQVQVAARVHTGASHNGSDMCPMAIRVTHITSLLSEVPSRDVIHEAISIIINSITWYLSFICPCVAEKIWMTQITPYKYRCPVRVIRHIRHLAIAQGAVRACSLM